MNLELALIGNGLLLLALLFLATVTAAVSRLSRVTLKALADKHEEPTPALLAALARSRRLFLLPLEFGIQVTEICLTLMSFLVLDQLGVTYALFWTLGVMVIVDALFRQLLPNLMTQRDSEEVLLKLLPGLALVYRPLSWVSTPSIRLLRHVRAERERVEPPLDEEAGEEEIQAYIGVGAEEGIFEKEETELIQSALEFGSTLVREIMTPRNEIVSIPEDSNFGQLREAFISSKHSRLPVTGGEIDQIVGAVFLRHFMVHLGRWDDESPILPLINEAIFVPETKKVSDLLSQFQETSGYMAIVVNEYGSVTGLVTIEDLVEEIVGEIHDEDEMRKVDLIKEDSGSYIVRGGMEVEDLEDQLMTDFGEPDVTTVSGLVVNHLGRVPGEGERVVLGNGMSFEILSADQRRIDQMRIHLGDSGPRSRITGPHSKETDRGAQKARRNRSDSSESGGVACRTGTKDP